MTMLMRCLHLHMYRILGVLLYIIFFTWSGENDQRDLPGLS